MKHSPIHYHDYLRLESLLGSQKRRSEEIGLPAHDEMLFITIHQVYELWFKQILFELDAVRATFQKDPLPDRDFATAVRRLERVNEILQLSLGQIDILETMTPLDFLDFRDLLYPASGFQSTQWRLFEIKLGLRVEDRLSYNQSPFHKSLPEHQQSAVLTAMDEPSLYDSVDQWLSRTPFLQMKDYNFWQSYKTAVLDLLNEDRQIVQENKSLPPETRERNLKMIAGTEDTFRSLFDEKAYEDLRQKGLFRLSAKALHAALFIQVYRDEPMLQQPFNLLSALLDLDEVMTTWRYRHAQMAMRMLGRKIGTGGSSGHDYLRDATEKHRIFGDLTRLATYLIPRSKIPPLPPEIRKRLEFTTP